MRDSKSLRSLVGGAPAPLARLGRNIPKAPCGAMVYTLPSKGLPYHNFGVCVYALKLHGNLGIGQLHSNCSAC